MYGKPDQKITKELEIVGGSLVKTTMVMQMSCQWIFLEFSLILVLLLWNHSSTDTYYSILPDFWRSTFLDRYLARTSHQPTCWDYWDTWMWESSLYHQSNWHDQNRALPFLLQRRHTIGWRAILCVPNNGELWCFSCFKSHISEGFVAVCSMISLCLPCCSREPRPVIRKSPSGPLVFVLAQFLIL